MIEQEYNSILPLPEFSAYCRDLILLNSSRDHDIDQIINLRELPLLRSILLHLQSQ